MARALRALLDRDGSEREEGMLLVLAGALEDLKLLRLMVQGYMQAAAKAGKRGSRGGGRRRR
jgi:hypothetical protein